MSQTRQKKQARQQPASRSPPPAMKPSPSPNSRQKKNDKSAAMANYRAEQRKAEEMLLMAPPSMQSRVAQQINHQEKDYVES